MDHPKKGVIKHDCFNLKVKVLKIWSGRQELAFSFSINFANQLFVQLLSPSSPRRPMVTSKSSKGLPTLLVCSWGLMTPSSRLSWAYCVSLKISLTNLLRIPVETRRNLSVQFGRRQLCGKILSYLGVTSLLTWWSVDWILSCGRTLLCLITRF